jgi:diacylglycerol O-acyltransferase
MSAPRPPQSNEEGWALAGGWGVTSEMSPFESLMWRAERDPRLRSTMTSVYVLDGAPDWDRLRAAHDWATHLVPRLRQRVVDPPLQLGAPAWVVDPEFGLDHHLRRVHLPHPQSFGQVLELAEQVAMAPFDRAHPPWEAVLVDGLEDGRAAYILKIHHSMADGQGTVQLISLLHSRTREPSPRKPMPEPPAPGRVSPAGVLAEQLGRRAMGIPRDGGRAVLRAARVAGRMAAEPVDSVAGAVRFGRSLQRVLTPPPVAPSPLLRGRSLSWRFGTLETGLSELKAAGRAAGGTTGDAFIAVLLGGLRRYHERYAVEVDALPMAMPISLRTGDDAMGGNRFAGARFAAPVGERDPSERIRLIHDFVLTARAEPAIDALGVLAPALAVVPTRLLTEVQVRQTRALDLQATNIPGLAHSVYLAGARIERIYPFGPLPGCAVMAALLSHVGACCIGINCDAAAVTDMEAFMDCMQLGLDEVLAIGVGTTAARTRRSG